ncbi:MAG: hypothetical protein WBC95_01220, partial [Albidovulum sp.]
MSDHTVMTGCVGAATARSSDLQSGRIPKAEALAQIVPGCADVVQEVIVAPHQECADACLVGSPQAPRRDGLAKGGAAIA